MIVPYACMGEDVVGDMGARCKHDMDVGYGRQDMDARIWRKGYGHTGYGCVDMGGGIWVAREYGRAGYGRAGR